MDINMCLRFRMCAHTYAVDHFLCQLYSRNIDMVMTTTQKKFHCRIFVICWNKIDRIFFFTLWQRQCSNCTQNFRYQFWFSFSFPFTWLLFVVAFVSQILYYRNAIARRIPMVSSALEFYLPMKNKKSK